MGFNRGEWSELYSFLYLLENPDLEIVDENFNVIDNNIFKILNLVILNKAKYEIINNNKVVKIDNFSIRTEYDGTDIIQKKNFLLKRILEQKKSGGSFEIPEVQPLIDTLLDGSKLKGASKVKGDIAANLIDSKLNRNVYLNYNIKSNLGANPTLLNASDHTNFIYKIENINDKIMNHVNSITTRKKLIDRMNYLVENGAQLNFEKTESDIFSNNLRIIDSDLSEILAKILIFSYSKNNKNISKLLEYFITDQASRTYYERKICDFANAVTFGMRAGENWDGTNEVNGGIISVTASGEVYLLDLIYFSDEVNKYLKNNIYLESPSSSRYSMLDIYKVNNEYYTKLNLQIRCK